MSSIIIVSDWGDREFSEPTDARFPLSFHQLLKYNISAFHPLSLNQSAGFYTSFYSCSRGCGVRGNDTTYSAYEDQGSGRACGLSQRDRRAGCGVPAIPNMTHKGQKSLKHFGFGSLKDHTR